MDGIRLWIAVPFAILLVTIAFTARPALESLARAAWRTNSRPAMERIVPASPVMTIGPVTGSAADVVAGETPMAEPQMIGDDDNTHREPQVVNEPPAQQEQQPPTPLARLVEDASPVHPVRPFWRPNLEAIRASMLPGAEILPVLRRVPVVEDPDRQRAVVRVAASRAATVRAASIRYAAMRQNQSELPMGFRFADPTKKGEKAG